MRTAEEIAKSIQQTATKYSVNQNNTKTTKSLENYYKNLYKPSVNVDESRSVLDRVGDVLSVGQYTTMGVIKGIMNNVQGTGGPGVAEGFVGGLKAANPFGKGYVKGEHSFSHVLRKSGWEPTTTAGRIGKMTVGLVGDIFLDPTTYMSGGLTALFKGSGKTGAKLFQASRVSNKLGEFEKLGYKVTDNYLNELPKQAYELAKKELSASADKLTPVQIEYAANRKMMEMSKELDNLHKFDMNVATDYSRKLAKEMFEKTGVKASEEQILSDAKQFYEKYNTLAGVKEDRGISLSLANAPFGKKIFKGLADKSFTVATPEAYKKFGDVTLAPAMTKVRDAFYGSKLANMLSTNSVLYNIAKKDPEQLFKQIKFLDMIKGQNLDKVSEEMEIRKIAEALNLSPSERKQFLQIAEDKKLWGRVKSLVTFAKTQEAEQIKKDMTDDLSVKQQELDSIIQEYDNLKQQVTKQKETSDLLSSAKSELLSVQQEIETATKLGNNYDALVAKRDELTNSISKLEGVSYESDIEKIQNKLSKTQNDLISLLSDAEQRYGTEHARILGAKEKMQKIIFQNAQEVPQMQYTQNDLSKIVEDWKKRYDSTKDKVSYFKSKFDNGEIGFDYEQYVSAKKELKELQKSEDNTDYGIIKKLQEQGFKQERKEILVDVVRERAGKTKRTIRVPKLSEELYWTKDGKTFFDTPDEAFSSIRKEYQGMYNDISYSSIDKQQRIEELQNFISKSDEELSKFEYDKNELRTNVINDLNNMLFGGAKIIDPSSFDYELKEVINRIEQLTSMTEDSFSYNYQNQIENLKRYVMENPQHFTKEGKEIFDFVRKNITNKNNIKFGNEKFKDRKAFSSDRIRTVDDIVESWKNLIAGNKENGKYISFSDFVKTKFPYAEQELFGTNTKKPILLERKDTYSGYDNVLYLSDVKRDIQEFNQEEAFLISKFFANPEIYKQEVARVQNELLEARKAEVNDIFDFTENGVTKSQTDESLRNSHSDDWNAEWRAKQEIENAQQGMSPQEKAAKSELNSNQKQETNLMKYSDALKQFMPEEYSKFESSYQDYLKRFDSARKRYESTTYVKQKKMLEDNYNSSVKSYEDAIDSELKSTNDLLSSAKSEIVYVQSEIEKLSKSDKNYNKLIARRDELIDSISDLEKNNYDSYKNNIDELNNINSQVEGLKSQFGKTEEFTKEELAQLSPLTKRASELESLIFNFKNKAIDSVNYKSKDKLERIDRNKKALEDFNSEYKGKITPKTFDEYLDYSIESGKLDDNVVKELKTFRQGFSTLHWPTTEYSMVLGPKVTKEEELFMLGSQLHSVFKGEGGFGEDLLDIAIQKELSKNKYYKQLIKERKLIESQIPNSIVDKIKKSYSRNPLTIDEINSLKNIDIKKDLIKQRNNANNQINNETSLTIEEQALYNKNINKISNIFSFSNSINDSEDIAKYIEEINEKTNQIYVNTFRKLTNGKSPDELVTRLASLNPIQTNILKYAQMVLKKELGEKMLSDLTPNQQRGIMYGVAKKIKGMTTRISEIDNGLDMGDIFDSLVGKQNGVIETPQFKQKVVNTLQENVYQDEAIVPQKLEDFQINISSGDYVTVPITKGDSKVTKGHVGQVVDAFDGEDGNLYYKVLLKDINGENVIDFNASDVLQSFKQGDRATSNFVTQQTNMFDNIKVSDVEIQTQLDVLQKKYEKEIAQIKKRFDNRVNSPESLQRKLDEATSNYESSKIELESKKSELSKLNEQINSVAGDVSHAKKILDNYKSGNHEQTLIDRINELEGLNNNMFDDFVQADSDLLSYNKRIEEKANKIKEIQDILATDDAFENYVKGMNGEDFVKRAIQNESMSDRVMDVILDTQAELPDKIRDAVKILRKEFYKIGQSEIELGKLDEGQFDNMMNFYVTHMATEEFVSYKKALEANPDMDKNVVFDAIGFGSKGYNPYGQERSIKKIKIGDEWIENPNIVQLNEYFKPVLKGKNAFSENVADLYVNRAMKNLDLMYDDKYMRTMIDVFGDDIDVAQKAEYENMFKGFSQNSEYFATHSKALRETLDNLWDKDYYPQDAEILEANGLKNFNGLKSYEIDKLRSGYKSLKTEQLKQRYLERARQHQNSISQVFDKLNIQDAKDGFKYTMNIGMIRELFRNYGDAHLSLEMSRQLRSVMRASSKQIDAESEYFAQLLSDSFTLQTIKAADPSMIDGPAKELINRFGSDFFKNLPDEIDEDTLKLIQKEARNSIRNQFKKSYAKENFTPEVRKEIADKYLNEALSKVGIKIETLSDMATPLVELTTEQAKSLTSLLKETMAPDVDKFIDDFGFSLSEFSNYISNINKNIDTFDFTKQLKLVNDSITMKANQARKSQILKDQSRFLMAWDKVTSILKLNMTVVNPAFHMRNLYSNAFQTYLSLGVSALDPRFQAQTLKALNSQGRLSSSSVIEVISKDGSVKEIHWGEILAHAKAQGVLGKDYFGEEAKSMMGSNTKGLFGDKVKKLDPTNTGNFFAYRLGGKVGSAFENYSRLLHFAAAVKQGQSFAQAAETTNKFLFDYSDLTSFEQNVLRRVIPFYTWMRKNGALQIETILNNPGRYQMYFKAINAIEGSNEDDNGLVDKSILPRYFQNTVQTPFRVRKGFEGDYNPVFWNTAMPVNDLNRLDVFNPKGILQDTFSSLSPLIKAPVEQIANYNAFFEKPIVEEGGNQVTDRAKHLLSQIASTNMVKGFVNKEGTDLGYNVLDKLTGIKMSQINADYYKEEAGLKTKGTPGRKSEQQKLTEYYQKLYNSGEVNQYE